MNRLATMVDVGDKKATTRTAIAQGSVTMAASTLAAIRDSQAPKGDVLAAARIAGIMAAKRTPDLDTVVPYAIVDQGGGGVRDRRGAEPGCHHGAGALPGPDGRRDGGADRGSVAALTIYDMAKALDKTMVIGNIRPLEKRGGKSGDWLRKNAESARLRSMMTDHGEVVRHTAAGSGLGAAGGVVAGRRNARRSAGSAGCGRKR